MSATASSLAPPRIPPSTKLTKRKARRALELIGWLEPLRLAYPEFDATLVDSIEDLQLEANRNPEADRQLILSAIHLGHWRISDLLDELPISRKELKVILDSLVADSIVITRIPHVRNDLGGRPETLYLPAPNGLRK